MNNQKLVLSKGPMELELAGAATNVIYSDIH